MTHSFEIGDYLKSIGSVIKVTDKAICVGINNGQWLNNKDNSKWIPKSAIIIKDVVSGVKVLDDESKHLIFVDFKSWFKL